MKRYRKHTGILASALVAGVVVTNSFAAPRPIILKHDLDHSGSIDAEAEFKGLFDDRENLNIDEQSLLNQAYKAFQRDGKGTKLSEFDFDTLDQSIESDCKISQRFYLRDSISNISVRAGNFVGTAGNGAAFSVTHNGVGDVTSWDVNGIATWIFGEPCLDGPENREPLDAMLSAFVVAPFVEFRGKGSTNALGRSILRTGAFTEFQIFSGPVFNAQYITIQPYYQTDFQFDADIFGISGRWYGVNIERGLNGTNMVSHDLNYWWTLNGVVDYLNVGNAGQSGLASNTQYAWIGGSVGAHLKYKTDDFYGFYGNLGLDAFWDAINDIDALKFSAEAGIFLDQDEHSSLSLKYENGVDYRNLSKRDHATLALKIRF